MFCNVNVEFHNDMFFLYYLENPLLLKLRGIVFVCLMFSCFQNELVGTVLEHIVEPWPGLPGGFKRALDCRAPGRVVRGQCVGATCMVLSAWLRARCYRFVCTTQFSHKLFSVQQAFPLWCIWENTEVQA